MFTRVDEILLRRKLKVIVIPADVEDKNVNAPYVAAMMKNVQDLGFTFSKKLIETLLAMRTEDIISLYQNIVPNLKSYIGADKEYKPMYPNFPKQVLEADDVELFVNAIVHYLSDGILVPEYEKEERFPLLDSPELKIIDVGTLTEAMEIFTNLLGSKTSISEQDKKDIEVFIEDTRYDKYLPSEIPMKENKAVFGKILVASAPELNASAVKTLYSTATDVLRLVVALSDGDVSLANKNTRIRKFKRKERRFIMDLLALCNNLVEDMFKYQGLWITVAEIIHPGEFSNNKKYEGVVNAFKRIRENDKPMFFAGKVAAAIEENNVEEAVELLSKRPGEFARKLDKVVRIDDKKADFVVSEFEKVADKVASPVLWQVMFHFKSRNEENLTRVFFPKGNTAKVYARATDTLPEISEDICKKIVLVCKKAIGTQYKKREEMGKVYVDKDLKNNIVPFSQRSASSAFKMLTRGSRVAIPEDVDVIRSFIWWTNRNPKTKKSEYDDCRVDIDLSATFLDEEWHYVQHISYTNLRDGSLKSAHSGDIVNGGPYGGKGVAEFIDISLENVVENNARYVLVQVYAFTSEPFSELPCSFGWMGRSGFESGEIFEPKTVEQNMAVTSNSRVCIPVIIDCKERVMIWADLSVSERSQYFGNNVESNIIGTCASAYAVANMHRPSMYDLVVANAKARGVLVANRADADIIFSNNTEKPIIQVIETDENGEEVVVEKEKDVTIVTAYDLDYYMGKLL